MARKPGKSGQGESGGDAPAQEPAGEEKRAVRRGRRSTKEEGPDSIDVHVGGRVRLRRNLLGMSQEKLGEAIGLTFQQVQKYERGANRIGSSRLFDLSRVLDVPVSFFFDDMPEQLSKDRPTPQAHRPTEQAGDRDLLGKHETRDLVSAYYRIQDDGVRRKVFELTKAAAKSASGEEEDAV